MHIHTHINDKFSGQAYEIIQLLNDNEINLEPLIHEDEFWEEENDEGSLISELIKARIFQLIWNALRKGFTFKHLKEFIENNPGDSDMYVYLCLIEKYSSYL